MHHVAIMTSRSKLIEAILDGKKTIETRWYTSRRAPWNKISNGDIIYFKYAGQDITASAEVADVIQFDFSNPEKNLFDNIILDSPVKVLKHFANDIYVRNLKAFAENIKYKKYAIIIRLKKPQTINPSFSIDKNGFGNACAWLSVDHIRKIRL